MNDLFAPPPHADVVEAFVTQILRTGLMLTDIAADFAEAMPEDAFPGEHPGRVVIECLSGTAYPIVERAGIDAVRMATELLDEVADRTLEHLRLAIQLKERGEA